MSKNAHPPIYELKKNYNQMQGAYIHPDLVHFVADWVSIESGFNVAKIMDLINERNQFTNQDLNDTIKQLH